MDLVERYRPLLRRYGGYRQVRHQRASLAVSHALGYWLQRMPEASRRHWELARRALPSSVLLGAALARQAAVRLLFSLTGICLLPLRPLQPL
jgi:hypothetical protein